MQDQSRHDDGDNEPKPAAFENDEWSGRGDDVLQRRAGRSAEVRGETDQGDKLGDDQQNAAGHVVEAMHQRHQRHDQRQREIEEDDGHHVLVARHP